MASSTLIGTTWTVQQLFTGRKYTLPYYQREYAWTEKNVFDLLDDLTSRFLDEFDETHLPKQVSTYKGYFLGPIITSQTEDSSSLVDGQQRLTTLMLLLIQLRHRSKNEKGAPNLDHYIFGDDFGSERFNIDVDERNDAMRALLRDNDFNSANYCTASVRNINDRYNDIADHLSEELKDNKLICFIYWLLNKVIVIEISAPDEDMALEAFETMNDRGMQLSNTDMLKSYLLSKIGDKKHIDEANQFWRERISDLNELYKNAEADFLKVWLRGKYADTIRERRKGATPRDFDEIGTAFHRWVRNNHKTIGLNRAEDYQRFVNQDFKIMSSRWSAIHQACNQLKPGLEHVYYNSIIGITIQDLPIMAAVTPDDNEATFVLKAQLVASYLDLFVARRIVNYWNYNYSTIAYTIFNLAKEIRNLDLESLRAKLLERAHSVKPSFDGTKDFGLNYQNGKRIRYLLARMTSWIEQECGKENRFASYVNRYHKDPYQIEHIWPNKIDLYKGEFDKEEDFGKHRNKFGGLLLLPRSFNTSYGAKPYEYKLPHYYGQNLLAQSLHPRTYEYNTGMYYLIERTGLPFKPYPDGFSKEDIDERQELYQKICEQVWDPDRLLAIEPDGEGNSSSTQPS